MIKYTFFLSLFSPVATFSYQNTAILQLFFQFCYCLTEISDAIDRYFALFRTDCYLFHFLLCEVDGSVSDLDRISGVYGVERVRTIDHDSSIECRMCCLLTFSVHDFLQFGLRYFHIVVYGRFSSTVLCYTFLVYTISPFSLLFCHCVVVEYVSATGIHRDRCDMLLKGQYMVLTLCYEMYRVRDIKTRLDTIQYHLHYLQTSGRLCEIEGHFLVDILNPTQIVVIPCISHQAQHTSQDLFWCLLSITMRFVGDEC